MTARIACAVAWAAMLGAALFLLAPLLVIAAASFSPTPVFDLPTDGASLRWYRRIGTLDGFWPALGLSLQIALLSTAIALVLGTLAAIAMRRGRLPGAEALTNLLVSPLMMPGLVLGIALLQGFRFIGLIDVWTSLLIAHVVITIPYAVRTLYSALGLFDFTLIDAARTLGCSPAEAIVKVLLPNLAPAFITSAIFAFLASMDNYAVSIFFTNAWTKTLPIQMLTLAEEQPDPTIAAVSSLLIALVLVLLIVLERAIGLRRITEV